MFGFYDAGDPVENIIIGKNCAQKLLLGFNRMGRNVQRFLVRLLAVNIRYLIHHIALFELLICLIARLGANCMFLWISDTLAHIAVISYDNAQM